MFVAMMSEGIDTPESGVDDAEKGAEGIFARAFSKVSIRSAPIEQTACDSARELVADSAFWSLAYRRRKARRIFPNDSCNCVGTQNTLILAVGIEEFERTVEMIRKDKSANWTDRGIGLNSSLRICSSGSIRESQPEARRRREARRQKLQVRMVIQLHRNGRIYERRIDGGLIAGTCKVKRLSETIDKA